MEAVLCMQLWCVFVLLGEYRLKVLCVCVCVFHGGDEPVMTAGGERSA